MQPWWTSGIQRDVVVCRPFQDPTAFPGNRTLVAEFLERNPAYTCVEVVLRKRDASESLGMSVVGGTTASTREGIFVTNIVAGGLVDREGSIQDQDMVRTFVMCAGVYVCISLSVMSCEMGKSVCRGCAKAGITVYDGSIGCSVEYLCTRIERACDNVQSYK
eukprot:m.606889 g.606889  ORF g.606889 m.606889 type:complete len:162 (+) comp22474_c0_seq16:33-518(+)